MKGASVKFSYGLIYSQAFFKLDDYQRATSTLSDEIMNNLHGSVNKP